jgi:hypothetical protein
VCPSGYSGERDRGGWRGHRPDPRGRIGDRKNRRVTARSREGPEAILGRGGV